VLLGVLTDLRDHASAGRCLDARSWACPGSVMKLALLFSIDEEPKKRPWFVNIASTVSFFKILFPLPGCTPSFNKVAMIWQYSAGFAKQPAPPALKVDLTSAGSFAHRGRLFLYHRV
jgi:hypothetical protein